MRRAQRTRKKMKIVTPGARTVVHFKQKKPSHTKCGNCGMKISRSRLNPIELKRTPKVRRRPERPLPHLCPVCMREEIKKRVRG